MIVNFKNKYFSILGDSISTLAGYNPPENEVFYDWANKRLAQIFAPEDTWWGQVIDALGGRLLVNNSWSGSLVCKHPDCEIESYGCSDSRTGGLGIGAQTPDVVMILMGLNDFGWAMRPMPVSGEEDLAVFSVAYQTMLEKVKSNYPNTEIWCLTLPVGVREDYPDALPPLIRGGWHLEEYCRIIVSCAIEHGCRVLDLYAPDRPYSSMDGYHPTANGMQTIARCVLQQLQPMSY